jgi:DNA-binding XRE family transcriptional regulator
MPAAFERNLAIAKTTLMRMAKAAVPMAKRNWPKPRRCSRHRSRHDHSLEHDSAVFHIYTMSLGPKRPDVCGLGIGAQIFRLSGVSSYAVVPVAEWKWYRTSRKRNLLESETIPAEFADRLLSGESPLRVWRDYRGLSLQALAETCGVTRQMLSMIEHGKTKLSAALLGKLAGALGCDMDDLHV